MPQLGHRGSIRLTEDVSLPPTDLVYGGVAGEVAVYGEESLHRTNHL